jgi:hypothetical protein
MGKVRNINQREMAADCIIFSAYFMIETNSYFLYGRSTEKSRRPEDQDKNEEDESENVFIIA